MLSIYILFFSAGALTTELFAALKDLESFPQGKSVVNSLFLQLNSGISSENLISNLEEIVEDLKTQEKIAQTIKQNHQKICNSLEKFEKHINIIESNIELAQENLNNENPEMELLFNEISIKESELQNFYNEIETETEKRSEEKKQWIESDKENIKNIEAAIGAIRLTTQLKYDDPNIVLIQKKMNSLSQDLSIAIEKTNKIEYSSLNTFFSQITKYDPKTLEEILEKLETLKSELIQNKSNSVKFEEESESNYKQYIKSIENAIESNNQDLEILKTKQNRVKTTLQLLESEIFEEKERLSYFTSLLSSFEAICEDWQTLSETESSEHSEYILKISEIIELVNKDLQGMQEYFKNK